jgi:hypothetical protein
MPVIIAPALNLCLDTVSPDRASKVLPDKAIFCD